VQQGPKLVGTGAIGESRQGFSVALSGDGNTALVAGPGDDDSHGAVWVFVRSGSTWTQQGGKLIAGDAVGRAVQGHSVALSADGNTALVGGSYDSGGTGAAFVFVRSGATWTQQGPKLVATAGGGISVALSADGNTALVGSWGDNSVAVFTRAGSTWRQQGPKLVGSGAGYESYAGIAVVLSGDGNTALIGGSVNGTRTTWAFTRSGSIWTEQAAILVGAAENPHQGTPLALSGDGNTALIGSPFDSGAYQGALWVLSRSGTTWSQQGAKLVGTGAEGSYVLQGFSVALSADGNTALIGGIYENNAAGAVWGFKRSGTSWSQQGQKFAGTGAFGIAGFGRSIALSADAGTALIGGSFDNHLVGAAWVFVRP